MFRSARRKGDVREIQAAEPDIVGVLQASGLFDADYYLDANPDVAAAEVDPVVHYAIAGAVEPRNPNPYFDSAWYLEANADVREAGLNPLYHYISGGAAEGRIAGPDFDTAYYLAQNPEVSASGMNPLLHYIRYGFAEGRTASPYDENDLFEAAFRAHQQGLTGPAAALFSGARGDHVHFPILGGNVPSSRGGLPLPPLRLVQRMGSVTLEDFDKSGREIRETILRTLPKEWDWTGKRCLDFGSGVGRALRHFSAEAGQAEFWGCDIDGSAIRWSVQNLSPPFRFVQIGEVPTLPFEDSSFDLVFAVSVLSYNYSTWHQWLAELRRILKSGGVFFATFLGPTPMAEILGQSYFGRGTDFGMYIKNPFQKINDDRPAVFVSPQWLRSYWGSIIDIDYIAIDGLMEYQSFVVARKPAIGAPIRQQVPVLKLSTTQAFNADAVGRISPQIDYSLPFRESYGLDVAARSGVVVEGWVVFRDDVADRVTIWIDGRSASAETLILAGEAYRDWGAPVANFSARLDLSFLSRGIHKLEARLRGREGRTHCLSIPLIIR